MKTLILGFILLLISGCFEKKVRIKKYDSESISFNYSSNWSISSDEIDEDDNRFLTLVPKSSDFDSRIDIEYYAYSVDYPLYYKDFIESLHKRKVLKEISPKPLKFRKFGRFNAEMLAVNYLENEVEKTVQMICFDVDDYSACIFLEFENDTQAAFEKELKIIMKNCEFY